MTKFSIVRSSMSVIALAALAACGGGGDGGSDVSTGSPSAPGTSTTVQTGPQQVQLTGINIKRGDILAQTMPNTTKVSFLNTLFDRFTTKALLVSNAFAADGNKKILPGHNFGFTNRMLDGKLLNLGIKLKNKDGTDTACDTSTAEAKVHQTWAINPGKGHLLAKIEAPSVVNDDCSVTYKIASYVITETGAAIKVDFNDEQVANVIEAGNKTSNTSDRAVLIYTSGAIKTLYVNDDGNAVLETINTQTIPMDVDGQYKFAFNGTHLVAVPTDRQDAVLVFTVGSTSFKVITTKMSATPEDYISIQYRQQVLLDHTGAFLWYDMNEAVRKLDIENNNYTKWAPAQPVFAFDSFGQQITIKSPPPGRYGVRGRYNTWIMSDRCIVWNYESNEYFSLLSPQYITPVGVQWGEVGGANYSQLVDNYAYCANEKNTVFTRMNMDTKQFVSFDTDTLGLYSSSGRMVEMSRDSALLWGAVSLDNSDVKVLELNFETGQVIDRGVITAGDRQVIELKPVK